MGNNIDNQVIVTIEDMFNDYITLNTKIDEAVPGQRGLVYFIWIKHPEDNNIKKGINPKNLVLGYLPQTKDNLRTLKYGIESVVSELDVSDINEIDKPIMGIGQGAIVHKSLDGQPGFYFEPRWGKELTRFDERSNSFVETRLSEIIPKRKFNGLGPKLVNAVEAAKAYASQS